MVFQGPTVGQLEDGSEAFLPEPLPEIVFESLEKAF